MAESSTTIPVHNHGTISHLPHTAIATFPVGTFLENIAVRKNGTVLVSSMLAGEVYYLDPNAVDPQSTVQLIHSFNSDTEVVADTEATESEYGSKFVAEALVEDPHIPDLFYTFSGIHGSAGTWAVWSLDLRSFLPSAKNVRNYKPVKKIANVPGALWLNGGTVIPVDSPVLMMAESIQGKLMSCDLRTGRISVWLSDPLLGKATKRPQWPGVNGVQYFRGQVFMTNSDRGIVLRATVDGNTGVYVDGSLVVVDESLTGDDLCFDKRGNAYVATNPVQTVVKLPGIGTSDARNEEGQKNEDRMTILGGADIAETAGPTAVAFGRTVKDENCIYAVTTGGILRPVDGVLGEARIVRVDVGVRRESA